MFNADFHAGKSSLDWIIIIIKNSNECEIINLINIQDPIRVNK